MTLRAVLWGSFVLNLVLAGFAFLGAKPDHEAATNPPAVATSALRSKVESSGASALEPIEASGMPNLKEKIGLIRRLGGSSELIVTLMPFEVRARFQQEKERVYCGPTTEAWERGVTPKILTAEQRQRLEEIRLFGESTVRNLIGEEMLAARVEAYSKDPHLAGFSPEGLQVLAKIDFDAKSTHASVAAATSGLEARESMAQVEAARESQLRASLTPAEYAEFDLHMSRTATELKGHLSGLRMSDDQYEAVFLDTKPAMQSGNPAERNLSIADALALHVNPKTAVDFLALRDSKFRIVAAILSEGGISDSEIVAFHRAAVTSDNDPIVLQEMAQRLSPDLAERLRTAKHGESGRHNDARAR